MTASNDGISTIPALGETFILSISLQTLLTALSQQSELKLFYYVTRELGLGCPVHWGEQGQPSDGVTEGGFQPVP